MSDTDTDYTLSYMFATLTNGTCGTFNNWSEVPNVTEIATSTSYNPVVPSGKCYKFQYQVADIAGHIATSSNDIVQVGTIPTATNVTVSGEPTFGKEITGTYTFNDAENDDQGSSICVWHRMDNDTDPVADGELITSIACNTADNKSTYTTVQDDLGKYIKLSVIPVSTHAPATGEPVLSSNAIGPIFAFPEVGMADSSKSYINATNKISFNIQCKDIVDINTGTLDIYYSFDEDPADGIDWKPMGSTSTPVNNYTHSVDNINLDTVNPIDYSGEGLKKILCKVQIPGTQYIATSSTAFEITKDTVLPTINDSNYPFNNIWATSTQNITLNPQDEIDGTDIKETKYCWGKDLTCDPTDITSGNLGKIINITIDTEDTLYYQTWDNAGNASLVVNTVVKIDTTPPENWSINYDEYPDDNLLMTINVVLGTDAMSGTSTDPADYLLEYDKVAYTGGNCNLPFTNTWEDTDINEAFNAVSYNKTLESGNCYRFRYTVADVAGNKFTYTSTTIVKVGSPPEAKDLSLTGLRIEGEILTGGYTFYDLDNDPQGTSTFKWLSSININGPYSEITNATSTTYITDVYDRNNYVKFQVTPISATGVPSIGLATTSEPMGPIIYADTQGVLDATQLTEYTEISLPKVSDCSADLFENTLDIKLGRNQKLKFDTTLVQSTDIATSSKSIQDAITNISGTEFNGSQAKKVTFCPRASTKDMVVSSIDNYSAIIKASTNIYSANTWDETIAPPISATTSAKISGYPLESVQFVGYQNATILLDKPAKVTLALTTGVPYYSVNGNDWARITNICNDINGTGLEFPYECYIHDGDNTIIWTYHFTYFADGAENIGLKIKNNGVATYIAAVRRTPSSTNLPNLVVVKNNEKYHIPYVPIGSPYASSIHIVVDGIPRALRVFGWE